MSVRLRLRRMGKKKQPFYRIVAIDSRAARDARYLENLGTYDPLKKPANINVNEDRALYWLGQGAIPSNTVRSFLKRQGILLKWHLMKKGADDAAISEEMKKWEVLQLDREKRLEALSEQKKRESDKQKAKAKEAEEAEVKAQEDTATPESQDASPAPAEAAVEAEAAVADESVQAEVSAEEATKEGAKEEAKAAEPESEGDNADDGKTSEDQDGEPEAEKTKG